ncbi:TPA: HAMP domain-containing histidine kinase [Salmonella enterica]|uniref:histidine kinase n=1 Tax=Salmonella enterica TaxID=28901 RepID=A0A759MC40_SALER|nr:HAMP domain-containing histidine kinase [Salmonella enterica subsp. enterica serovar Hvittingfoss]EGF6523871.1 HAMP domain-containing histidine kinase [Salmonella enterica]MJK44735.1 sensor histidine kinase [Salmonella enterica subsp. diarizonae]EHL2774432.1 HAMP domain-containing histidine kinase [Salmonella enterica subsp. enterica serovar Hvittingfoss]EHL2852498.1 HAMP domain-containing histidine kinase [Salmonella enterica subsp. enterica serovar Hvittingfoss]
MIYRLSLSQRLTLVFTTIILICAVAVSVVQIRSSKQYGDAMVQRLSLELAKKIVKSELFIDASGQVNRQTLKGVFDHLMTLNPSVELYLVSPAGDILADAAPPGHIQRQKVAILPIQNFLRAEALPVYGDDPRSSQQKVFSAAPVMLNGDLHGYLYIILQGEELNMLADTVWQKTLWNTVVGTLILVLLACGIAGFLVWRWVTHPVQTLIGQVIKIEQDSISVIKQLAQGQPDSAPANEIALLNNAFIELAQKIAQQWDLLADSDRQRREFIANISHDLRTPLTSLLGYLEMLSLKADTMAPEENRHYLSIALRQGHKVRHLSQQLFELARLEHGGIKPQRERFAIDELIQDVAQKFDLSVATRHLQLHLDVEWPLPLVNADLSMMERVVTNLLDNAIRHTPDGGDVWLKVWRDENRLLAEVCDSGPGVEEGIREVLFQRPTGLLPQEQRTERGGLGLLIVRRMLELHGGDINLVNSTAGACFRFSLPL